MAHMLMRRVFLSSALVMMAVLPGSAKTTRTGFDGEWSVLIITDAGACDRAYRYGLRIAGGQLYYDGGMGVALSGRVDLKGNIGVRLQFGDAVARGSGRLTRSAGSGRWQGASPSGRCSGRWQAERRK